MHCIISGNRGATAEEVNYSVGIRSGLTRKVLRTIVAHCHIGHNLLQRYLLLCISLVLLIGCLELDPQLLSLGASYRMSV